MGHLYRRVTAPIDVTEGDHTWTIPPGDLIDLYIRPANADPDAVGTDPLDLCPARPLPHGVNAAALRFGDGAHRCPGQPLALLETDTLLTRLLASRPRVLAGPALGWDNLIEGYQARDMADLYAAPNRAAARRFSETCCSAAAIASERCTSGATRTTNRPE